MTLDSVLDANGSGEGACSIEPDTPRDGSDAWRRRLRAVVAGRVVPQLAARCRSGADGRAESLRLRAVTLAQLAVTAGLAACMAAVDAWLCEDIALQTLFLEVLTPATRHLGDLWLADDLSFLDVTRGASVLQAVLRLHAPAFEAEAARCTGRTILLAPVPGEQHVFGLSVLATFFRRAGWRVMVEPRIDEDGLLARSRAERIDVVGLSASGTRFARRLPGLIDRLRVASMARDLRVLVGGAAFLDGMGDLSGADAVARDATEALHVAETLTRVPAPH